MRVNGVVAVPGTSSDRLVLAKKMLTLRLVTKGTQKEDIFKNTANFCFYSFVYVQCMLELSNNGIFILKGLHTLRKKIGILDAFPDPDPIS